MIHAPSSTDILAGLDLNELADLSPAQLALLAVLMARISERSYRRGVQQGVAIADKRPGDMHPMLYEWRYGMPTDASPAVDGFRVEAAVSRLLIEQPGLRPLLPDAPQCVGTWDMDALVERGVDLSRRYSAAFGKGDASRYVSVEMQAFGYELCVLGGGQLLSDVFDEIVERHGGEAVRGLESSWSGIGGWG